MVLMRLRILVFGGIIVDMCFEWDDGWYFRLFLLPGSVWNLRNSICISCPCIFFGFTQPEVMWEYWLSVALVPGAIVKSFGFCELSLWEGLPYWHKDSTVSGTRIHHDTLHMYIYQTPRTSDHLRSRHCKIFCEMALETYSHQLKAVPVEPFFREMGTFG